MVWKKLNMQVKFLVQDLKYCLNLYSADEQKELLLAIEKKLREPADPVLNL